ncbi:MAG: ABC transporter ATP-binding protein [Clostridia bacterium]|nr:ABC transporter ATP-binding protein [Clostridia bacterium]
MKILVKYLKPYVPRMALGFVYKFTGTIMDLLLPWILAYIIDEIVPLSDMGRVIIWGAAMVACAVLAVLGNVIANRMASAVARDVTRTIRNDLFGKIQKLSCRQFGEYTESSLISRMTSDTYNVHHVIGMMQRLGVRAPLLLIGGIIVTMTLDPALSFILVAMLPLLGITVYFVSKKGIPLYQIHQSAADTLIRKVRESITGIRVIKALSKVDYEKERFEKINIDVVNKETKAGITMAITNPVMNFLLNMGWVLIILAGAWRVNEGLTQPGKIIAFLTYFTIILNAMLSITRLFVMFSKAGSSMERIEAVLTAKQELETMAEQTVTEETVTEKTATEGNAEQTVTEEIASEKTATEENAEEKVTENVQGVSAESGYHIEFEHVTFSYNKNNSRLEDINFRLKRGRTLGIIGATGSGKSTLINLLMRLYDADSGVIRINGRDIRSYSNDELHKMFGVAFQNDTIFEDSVNENITLGRDIEHEQVEAAAKYAQIAEHIENMPDGYMSMLAIKGANLSGGQKQRVLIARALAGNPDILVLDDSSSALDYKTDAAVRNAIRNNYSDTTTIIVAQRVSSVMNADMIIVIDEGRIIGSGTHDELMRDCVEYREISRLQMNECE